MMKSKTLIAGSTGDVVVWRLKSGGPIDFIAASKDGGQAFLFRKDGIVSMAFVDPAYSPVSVAIGIVAADSPETHLDNCIQSKTICSVSSPLAEDPFAGKWAFLVQTEMEKQMAAPVVQPLDVLEF